MARLRAMVGKRRTDPVRAVKDHFGYKNPPRTRAGAEKALDKQIEAAYYRVASGVQVSIMDIPAIFRDAKAMLAGGRTDIDQVLIEVVKRYQVAGHGGRLLNNPPAFIVIDSKSGVVQFRKAASGMGTSALNAAIERAGDMAAKLGRSFLVFLDIRGYKVGAKLALPMVRVSGATEVMPDGRVVRGNSKKNPLTEAEHRQIMAAAKHDGDMSRHYDALGDKFNAGQYVGRANRGREIANNYSPRKNPAGATRCNPGICKNPGHRHAVKNPSGWSPIGLFTSAEATSAADRLRAAGIQVRAYETVPNHVTLMVPSAMRRAAKALLARKNPMLQMVTLANPSSASAIKARMVHVLKIVGEGLVDDPASAEFDREAAIYWFAADHHKGQADPLYSILSTSKFKPGPSHRSVADEGEIAEAFYRVLVQMSKKLLKNPLTRWEAAQVLKQARYRLSMARSRKWRGLRDAFSGEAEGMAAVVESRGPASARKAAHGIVRRAVRTRLGMKKNPLRPAGIPYCHMCGNWSKAKGPYRPAPGNVGWMTGKPMCKLCREGAQQLQAEGFDFSKKTTPHRVPKRGYHPNPSAIPFKQGQIITVEQALAWAKKTGNASLIKQCQQAIALCKKANGPAVKVRFDLVQMGDPKKIESVMAGVEYGETDETVYKPTKGSKKGQHLYRHEWGEGTGRRKPVPLIAPVGGKALVMPLGNRQTAGDWLRG